ncbi:MAG: hypothetical protein QF579_04615 [Dehalococcoidia bacterium]|nr:hypothetical protein [Dehalococcoidia bacterium]
MQLFLHQETKAILDAIESGAIDGQKAGRNFQVRRTGSSRGGSPTRADRRLDLKATGQAGEKGRSKVKATCCGSAEWCLPQVMLPPSGGAGGIAMRKI